MKILVTGGAGYIGSHTIRELEARGHEVVALDNLERGHAQSIRCPLLKIDLRDELATRRAVASQLFDGVIHFAAYCSTSESVAHPEMYFGNNVRGTINLLNALVANGIKRLVFSSTCAVYGQPDKLPVAEDNDFRPESPYGESKYLVERMLPWYDRAHGLKTVAFRYFNASGASLDGSIGDEAGPRSRLIPNMMKAALGVAPSLTLYGTDYPTPDGTCLRDYIHVLDLAEAHLLALEHLTAGGQSDFLNLGTGVPYSNLQIVNMMKKVSGIDFPVNLGPRRPGDPAEVYADNRKARRVLNWGPKHSDLETIIRSDWAWHSKHPHGYGD